MTSLGKRAAVAVAAMTLLLCAGGAGSAAAKSTIFSFVNTPTSTQAGGHPSVITTFQLGTRNNQGPKPPCECNDPKDITIHTPAGVIANPHVVSECTAAEFATFTCPADSQAGFAVLKVFGWSVLPLYRTVPQAGQAALFAFPLPLGAAIPAYIAVNARTGGDYGLDFKVLGITHTLTPDYFANVFWGVPGAPSHDFLRYVLPQDTGISCQTNPVEALAYDTLPADCNEKEPHATSLPIEPFTQSPTTCVGPLVSTIETLAYDNETDYAETVWPATTGCDKLSFDPSLAAAPTTTETDSASGLEVDLKVPQYQDPNTPSPSAIRASTVTLPEGFSINPNAADGKVACTDAEANFGSTDPSHCPEFSRVGTTSLDSSALPAPIPGSIYLGEPKPGDRYRIILTASGFGTNVKISGSIHLDPSTGQIVTSFENLPQAPFQEFDLHFFGSERGLLATPEQCGTFPVKTTFKPWAAELSDQTSTQFFTLTSGPGGKPCPNGARPFGPTLQAGVSDNTAGVHTQFGLRLDRSDGDQNLSNLNVKLPPGFAATLKGVPYCPDASIAQFATFAYSGLAEQISSSCPGASRVGTVVAAAGAGSRPVHVDGKAYLAGPYKGAPLSLFVVIPAVSGPYDLGNVAVRVAIQVDPVTARVTAVSDPLPQILEGVPVRTRMIQVVLDRPDFALNPTNCDPFAVEAEVTGDEGTIAPLRAHFQVANCADLPLRPRLSMRLSGGVNRRGHPAIHAVLQTSPGESNLRGATVMLPKGELLDNAHIGTVCTRVQFAKNSCPAGSQIGTAEALSPLLDGPIKGSVYLRSSSHQLPDLAIDLEGQIDIAVAARVDSVRGRLRTAFEDVPDAPVSRFTVDLMGGAKGLLSNSESLCGPAKKATFTVDGQNGKTVTSKVKLKVASACVAARKRQRSHHRDREAQR